MSDRYAAQLQEICENTVIRGYATDYFGRYLNGMVIPAGKAQRLIDAGLTESVSLTWQVSNLRFLGIPRKADGTETELEEPFIPTEGFAVETLLYKLSKEPKWIAINSIGGAPAFYYENDPAIRWLPGYSESCLTGADADLCVLPESLMERCGIELGDTVRFMAWIDNEDAPFVLYDFLVAGSNVLAYGEEVIYTPLGLNFPTGSEPGPAPQRKTYTERAWLGNIDTR